ncbi:MAG TPA: hypothetical protein VFF07_03520 [Actinomycetota bacterium]|nr:hypothetical protein [Actinomycetota bacterium]
MAAGARWGWLGKGQDAVRSSRVRIALTLLVILALGVAGGVGTWAAFSNTTVNSGNGFAAGSVDLDDNDAGLAMLSITNGTPGATDTSCVRVTYNGSPASSVRLYGTTSGSGLDPYLNLVVTRGSVPAGTFDSCASFTADATNYIGAGNGVIFNGTLQGYADSYAVGLVDPTGALTRGSA